MTSSDQTAEPNAESGGGSRNSPMILAEGLCKYYGAFAAVDDVGFSVPANEVCAFLGPNGAGKSTTMKLLTGYLAPTRGRVRIAGLDMETDRIEASQHIGYLPENGPLYNEMTPKSALLYLARVRGLTGAKRQERFDFVREKCDLGEVWRKPIGKLSRGFRQRVGMAQALLHDPRVLILDEPTSGLDPNQLVGIRQLIRELGNDHTVLLSTHILQEVLVVCRRVILINEGRLVLDQALSEVGDLSKLESTFHELTGFSQVPQTAGP